MKNLTFLTIALFLTLQSFGQMQEDNDTIIANNPPNLKLKVFYFHITNRCNTCRSIESNVRATLKENFGYELENGVIDLYVLNCELPENQMLVEKYEAYGATLVITSFLNGTEQETEDLTAWAFKRVYDPGVFKEELTEKINVYIK